MQIYEHFWLDFPFLKATPARQGKVLSVEKDSEYI